MDEDKFKELVERTDKFLNDILPQISRVCVQDFENLNELCMLLTELKDAQTK